MTRRALAADMPHAELERIDDTPWRGTDPTWATTLGADEMFLRQLRLAIPTVGHQWIALAGAVIDAGYLGGKRYWLPRHPVVAEEHWFVAPITWTYPRRDW